MPRLRLRRLVLFLVAVATCSFVALNLTFHSREVMVVVGKLGDHNLGSNLAESAVRRKPKFENPVTSSHLISLPAGSKSSSSSLYSHSSQSVISHLNNLKNRYHHRGLQSLTFKVPSGEKLWFMKNGKLRPEGIYRISKPHMWPEQDGGDRIVEQLMYMPPNYTSSFNFTSSGSYQRPKLKKILLYFGKGGWNDLPLGRTVFLRDKCPVNTCELTTALREAEHADAIFFKDRFLWPFYKRNPNQVWVLFLLECPLHTQGFKNLRNVFNWTATYRHDSDLVAPYEKFVPFELDGEAKSASFQTNYAVNKTKKVAWFVSNCNARNKRLEYAKELAQHIEVDIYGSCGNKRCPRALTHKCFKMLDRDYKFYLAFENSNCKDYITEKFFVNGLSRDVVPIVMGARQEDYARASPPHSYIHVDDFESPKELAEYLHILDQNDTLYNEYFRWKGTGEFVNTYFWCRMCALLHAPLYHKSYADMHHWWAGPGTCNAGHWKPQKTTTTSQAATGSMNSNDGNENG